MELEEEVAFWVEETIRVQKENAALKAGCGGRCHVAVKSEEVVCNTQ